MIALVLCSVLSASPDALVATKVGEKLTLKAPPKWEQASAGDDEPLPTKPGEGSRSWASPDGLAKMEISVFNVDPVRPARACVQQMVEALSQADGVEVSAYTATTVGAQPASKRVNSDYLGDKDTEKTEANKVTTTTVVGCNGRSKWLLTFSAKTSEGARFGPMLKRVLDSLQYVK